MSDEQIRSQHDGNERRYPQKQAPQGSRLCPTPAIAEAGCENQGSRGENVHENAIDTTVGAYGQPLQKGCGQREKDPRQRAIGKGTDENGDVGGIMESKSFSDIVGTVFSNSMFLQLVLLMSEKDLSLIHISYSLVCTDKFENTS